MVPRGETEEIYDEMQQLAGWVMPITYDHTVKEWLPSIVSVCCCIVYFLDRLVWPLAYRPLHSSWIIWPIYRHDTVWAHSGLEDGSMLDLSIIDGAPMIYIKDTISTEQKTYILASDIEPCYWTLPLIHLNHLLPWQRIKCLLILGSCLKLSRWMAQ